FSAPPTTYISPLSLHDALPIYDQPARARPAVPARPLALAMRPTGRIPDRAPADFPAVCVMGPTAAGKTELAVRLIEAFPFEIIRDRKSTRLNSSHVKISYAVFC